jgi:hypothetical protein
VGNLLLLPQLHLLNILLLLAAVAAVAIHLAAAVALADI